MKTAIAACLVLCGCGAATPPTDPNAFNPPALQAGFTRYALYDVPDIMPGGNVTMCQWLEAPAAQDRYVTLVTGAQSQGGHHVILYASKKVEDVGTNRFCTNDDQVYISYLGSLGGEGLNTSANANLPANIAFMLPKGYALMANVHFLNATPNTIDGKGVVDVKYVPASADLQIANEFANTSINLNVTAGQVTSLDLACTFQSPLAFFRFANHEHERGRSVESWVVRADGTRVEIANNTSWTSDMIFNFPFVNWPLDTPFQVNAGDTLHTQCTWDNETGTTYHFPDEMCAGFGYYVPGNGTQIDCVDGAWQAP